MIIAYFPVPTHVGSPRAEVGGLKIDRDFQTPKLFLLHEVKDGTPKLFPVETESAGMRQYIGLIGILDLLVNAHTFVALDGAAIPLHPELVSFLLRVFLENAGRSQLLVATNELSLMDKAYMRNDMVWFCEKEDDVASVYYPAEDFSLHKHVSLMNAYQSGTLGAMPHLGSPFLQRDGKRLQRAE
jgi:AAA15 family ATPase/GTPase